MEPEGNVDANNGNKFNYAIELQNAGFLKGPEKCIFNITKINQKRLKLQE